MFCKNCGNKIKKVASFCPDCGHKLQIKKFDIFVNFIKQHKKGVIISAVILAIIFISALSDSGSNTNNPNSTSNTVVTQPSSYVQPVTQSNNLSSVVNIYCDNDEGGSGTIRTKDGLILTNNHVLTGSTYCFITIPDQATGQPAEIYEAKPIIIPVLSKKYDLAGLSITGSYTDDNGKTWGAYPTIFPFFSAPSICDNYSPKLGEGITVYGYPVTSGGNNLTVTDGVISSFADDGTILTSAKIDSGNSGGLAMNKSGCFVGIPSAVISGNYQNLGVIIPQSLIDEFLSQIPKD